MKRTHRFTLIALTTLFVVTVAVLLASAPCESDRTNQIDVCLGTPLSNRVLPRSRAHQPLCRAYSERPGEDSTPEFSVSGFGPSIIRAW